MINTKDMMQILDSIARERNIDRSVLVRDLEQAMVSAARKYFNTLDIEEFTCVLDPTSGQFQMTRHGEPLDMPPIAFGRIAAQTFKQVMIQKFRDDERTSILDDFTKRIGEIVTGTAQRVEGGSLVVSIDRAEGFMPRSEQIPGEQFASGDRVRCMILDVRDAGSQVKIVLSRANPDFIKKLFEVEVPEVAEKIIEIKAMAREAGFRTKIAVASIDSKVDAVGACVGVRGSRIKNIVDELNGEKIDIVRWNESSQILIQNALKPAEVAEISLCFELGRATVVVRDDQLSLAIGKRGQNVRLAARLTGWDVDILTPDEFRKGLEIMYSTVQSVEGISEQMADKLAAMGMVSVFDIEEVGVDVLITELQIDTEVAGRMAETCAVKAKEVAEQQQRDKEEKERKTKQDAALARTLLDNPSETPGDAALGTTDQTPALMADGTAAPGGEGAPGEPGATGLQDGTRAPASDVPRVEDSPAAAQARAASILNG